MTGSDRGVRSSGLGTGRRRLGLLFEFEDLGPTDDAAQRQAAVCDGSLDCLDEALATHDAVTARQRLHRRLGR